MYVCMYLGVAYNKISWSSDYEEPLNKQIWGP